MKTKAEIARENGKKGGRPKGSTYLNLKEILEKKGEEDGKDYIAEFTEFLLANYMEDTKLMIWVGEHLFGKPQQTVDVTSGGKELPQPILHVLNNDGHKEGGGDK